MTAVHKPPTPQCSHCAADCAPASRGAPHMLSVVHLDAHAPCTEAQRALHGSLVLPERLDNIRACICANFSVPPEKISTARTEAPLSGRRRSRCHVERAGLPSAASAHRPPHSPACCTRPMGTSTAPLAATGLPLTSARYSFLRDVLLPLLPVSQPAAPPLCRVLAAKSAVSCRRASSDRAHSSTPAAGSPVVHSAERLDLQ